MRRIIIAHNVLPVGVVPAISAHTHYKKESFVLIVAL